MKTGAPVSALPPGGRVANERRRHFVRAAATVGGAALAGLTAEAAAQDSARSTSSADRPAWLTRVDRTFAPVLRALAAGRLRSSMPVETAECVEAKGHLQQLRVEYDQLLDELAPKKVARR